MNFAVPADHRVKLKEKKKRNKYIDLATELKRLRNMKVTVIPVIIGALGTIPKCLVKGQEDVKIRRQEETTQTTALLRSARIPKTVPET